MSVDNLSEILSCAIISSKKFGVKCPEIPRKVKVLVPLVEKIVSIKSPFKIELHARIYESELCLGAVDIYESKADIFYNLDQSHCWRRFVITKELCHILYFGEDGNHIDVDVGAVNELVTKIMAGLEKSDFNHDSPARSEKVTVFMALEMLMPFSDRERVEAIVRDHGVMAAALEYKIPVQFVSVYLLPLYQGIMERAYSIAEQTERALTV